MKIFSDELIAQAVEDLHIADLSRATIGEVLLTAQYLENKTGIPFIRMDQGSPGLPVNRYGVEAERLLLTGEWDRSILPLQVYRNLKTRHHVL